MDMERMLLMSGTLDTSGIGGGVHAELPGVSGAFGPYEDLVVPQADIAEPEAEPEAEAVEPVVEQVPEPVEAAAPKRPVAKRSPVKKAAAKPAGAS